MGMVFLVEEIVFIKTNRTRMARISRIRTDTITCVSDRCFLYSSNQYVSNAY
jgi:hypothetical protein